MIDEACVNITCIASVYRAPLSPTGTLYNRKEMIGHTKYAHEIWLKKQTSPAHPIDFNVTISDPHNRTRKRTQPHNHIRLTSQPGKFTFTQHLIHSQLSVKSKFKPCLLHPNKTTKRATYTVPSHPNQPNTHKTKPTHSPPSQHS